MTLDDQIIVMIAAWGAEMDLNVGWWAIRENWASLDRWQRWVDADFPGAT